MAIATTVTKLPLDTWAKIIGINPLHFNGVTIPDNNFRSCDQIIQQYEWQSADHVSREEIARAIAEAEAQIENLLGYHLKPTWEADEWRPATRTFDKSLFNINGSDIRGLNTAVKSKWGYVISGGREAKSVIEASSSITWQDLDNDGYDETGTVSVSTDVLDINEVGVFYPGMDGDDAWEIRPAEVAIDSGTATITFKRHQAVIAALLGERYVLDDLTIDGTDDSNFLTEVDVYRRYNDPQTQVSMLWEPMNAVCSNCDGVGCSACSYAIQTACLLIRGDPRQGNVAYHPAVWNSDTLSFDPVTCPNYGDPDIVRLWYYSGWRNKKQKYISRMDPEWERIVAFLACCYLDRPPCDCEIASWQYWRTDLSLVTGDEDGRPVFSEPAGILDNPFGSRRGAVHAWRKVRREAILSGIAIASV